MNLLLLQPTDIQEGRVVITGERALHIFQILRAKPGDLLKTGLRNGRIGSAEILETDREHTVLRIGDFIREAPPAAPMTLAVALPRPQSFKKVLHFAVSSGIRRICFFQSARVEKSFWNSSVLKKEALEDAVREGLEQGVDTMEPELHFFRRFRDFIDFSTGDFPEKNTVRILAHPTCKTEKFERSGRHILLTIGPEGGFVPSEVRTLTEHQFESRAFGHHILRVEFAAAMIAGCLLSGEQ